MKRLLGIAVFALATLLPMQEASSASLPYDAIACQTTGSGTSPTLVPPPPPPPPPRCADYHGKSCSPNGKQFTCNLPDNTQHKCYCEDSIWNCNPEDASSSPDDPVDPIDEPIDPSF